VKAPGSSTLTFVLFPIAVLAVEFFRGFSIVPWFALLVLSGFRFQAQVRRDERRLHERFGAEYEAYAARVKRWLPYLF
jgi:protein-S-isoprenylcysteine O-methyltransferase Ste14